MSARVRLPIAPDTEAMLPRVQARWVDAILGEASVPRETGATCETCAMVPGEHDDASRGIWFREDVRCCTYLPDLANFLVGGALDGSAEGARTVRTHLAEAEGVTPLGLAQHDRFRARYEGRSEAFGRDETLRCPHYQIERGRCTIWDHREATCATWFCKHVRGSVHKAFWNRLHQLLRAAEAAVARHCAIELGISPEGLAMLVPARSDTGELISHDVVSTQNRGDPALLPVLWGSWLGREEDFFRACATLADTLSWNDVLHAGGSELRAMAEVVRFGRAQTRNTLLPARVMVSGFYVLALDATSVRVQGYSYLDPLDVPRALFDVLGCFDGRPTLDAITAASAMAGEAVPEGAVRMLVDFGILTERR